MKQLTEQQIVDNWNKLYNDDFPFHIRNNNPLGQYMEYVLQILRGEMQLWGVLFHSNPLSVAVFLEICHTAINELHNLMKPLLDDNIYSNLSVPRHLYDLVTKFMSRNS